MSIRTIVDLAAKKDFFLLIGHTFGAQKTLFSVFQYLISCRFDLKVQRSFVHLPVWLAADSCLKVVKNERNKTLTQTTVVSIHLNFTTRQFYLMLINEAWAIIGDCDNWFPPKGMPRRLTLMRSCPEDKQTCFCGWIKTYHTLLTFG